MDSQLLAMNPVNFSKMAHGDMAGFMEMAFEYFNDTRRLMPDWRAMADSGNFSRLREDLHRCKGGASLFGLERMVSLLGEFESPAVLESRGFDLAAIENELKAAEDAVYGMFETAS